MDNTYRFYFLLILGFSLKMLFCLTAKIQALQKLNKTDDTDIQIQTGEFNEKSISALHYQVREEQNKLFK